MSDSQSFVYDNLQRLSSATGSYGTYGYTYDQDGNRLTQTLGTTTTTYGYGTGNDLLQTLSVNGTVTQTIGYTADGRMASFSPGLQSPGGQNTTALSYNQDGQLVEPAWFSIAPSPTLRPCICTMRPSPDGSNLAEVGPASRPRPCAPLRGQGALTPALAPRQTIPTSGESRRPLSS